MENLVKKRSDTIENPSGISISERLLNCAVELRDKIVKAVNESNKTKDITKKDDEKNLGK